MNWAAVKFWQKMGVARIILSRELSLDEIEKIRQECPDIELEVFVHGALCMAYSGRCLLSGYFNRRDSNQGTCTNACRWNYTPQSGSDQTDSGEVLPLKLEGDFDFAAEAAGSRAVVFKLRQRRAPPAGRRRLSARRKRAPRPAHAHHGRRARHLHHEQQGLARRRACGPAGEDRRRFAQDRGPHQERLLRVAHRAGLPPRHRRRRGRPAVQPGA